MSWKHLGACVGKPVEWFYGGAGGRHIDARAAELCASCPVRSECLDEAVRTSTNEDWGTWGGTSASERDRLRYGHGRSRIPQTFNPRVCKWCGQTFHPRSSNGAYCDVTCRDEADRQRHSLRADPPHQVHLRKRAS